MPFPILNTDYSDVKAALSTVQLDLSPADKDIVFAGTVKILKLAVIHFSFPLFLTSHFVPFTR